MCLFVPRDMSKADAAGITKLGIEMFHHESWKSIYFGVKGRGHEAQKNFAIVDCDVVVSAGVLCVWLLTVS